jgi:hypothetical protein
MPLPDDDDFTIPEDNEFCVALVKRVPALEPLMKKHLEEEEGEVLSYMFIADVAQWAEANAITNEESVRQIIAVLNDGLDRGEGDVPNLIVVGFVEAMYPDTPLFPLVTGSLKAWVDYGFGFSTDPPQLKSR